MKKILFLAAGCYLLISCNAKPADSSPANGDSTAATSEKQTPPAEFADAKYTDIGKKNLAFLASGDIDGWLAAYAENARFTYSSGDSLVGKAEISKYWKNRRGNVIDSLAFDNDIWIPLKVNQPQRGPDRAGTWLLCWYHTNVKYKNGKKLSFWVHIDHHFDSTDKIDQSIEYIDRAPINKALGK
jgi:hypothetical protein